MSGVPTLPAQQAEPTQAMLIAARDWSKAKYGIPIGNDAATGCWKAMYAALAYGATQPGETDECPYCHDCYPQCLHCNGTGRAALTTPPTGEPLTAPSKRVMTWQERAEQEDPDGNPKHWPISFKAIHMAAEITELRAVLAATAAPSEPTDEAIEDFLTPRMDLQGRVPMLKTIREALSHFAVAAPTESEPASDAKKGDE